MDKKEKKETIQHKILVTQNKIDILNENLVLETNYQNILRIKKDIDKFQEYKKGLTNQFNTVRKKETELGNSQ